jgi:hypothetical protein
LAHETHPHNFATSKTTFAVQVGPAVDAEVVGESIATVCRHAVRFDTLSRDLEVLVLDDAIYGESTAADFSAGGAMTQSLEVY